MLGSSKIIFLKKRVEKQMQEEKRFGLQE